MAQPSLTSEGTVGVSGALAAAAALADFSCNSTRAYPADHDQVSYPERERESAAECRNVTHRRHRQE